MKRLLFITTGSLLLLGIVISAFYIAGAVWGPLYANEAEATRNFKIFLGSCAFSIVVGAIVGNIAWKTFLTKRTG